MGRAVAALLLTAALAHAGDKVAALKESWPGLDRDSKVRGLMLLGDARSANLLRLSDRWLRDKDPVVRGHLLRVVARHTADPRLAKEAGQTIARYVAGELARRKKREDREFKEIRRTLKRKIPPPDQTTAGPGWADPYDEQRRRLPKEIREERLHMRLVVAAIEGTRAPALAKTLLAILDEHHDPEVVVRVVECFSAWKDFKALVPLADLLRIQQMGREVGGSDIIGRQRWNELRLKWDVYKDDLWWSRPEYLPRVVRPICKAASAITGAEITSARALDGWMLDHPALLKQGGVVLSNAFVKRARTTQG